MNKIAILVTTFLRDSLLHKTVQNIVDFYTNDCILLIGDQGYSSEEKDINIDYVMSQIPCQYYKLPFDCGLSYARNFLIKKASEMNIPYCLVAADSIQFNQKYDFNPIINFLETDVKIGKIGFDLEKSKCPWEYNMEVTPAGIKFSISEEKINYNNIEFLKVDICRNIFLAKTSSLIEVPYDEELKLAEHEEQAIRYKEKYKTYWTSHYSFKRIANSNTKEYEVYRKRFKEYRSMVLQKLKIKSWVIYP